MTQCKSSMEGIDEDLLQPYAMTPSPGNFAGICIVFNNVHFTDPRLVTRTGSFQDCLSIAKVFRCFGFQVEIREDYTTVGMMDCLRKTAKSYKSHHCAFVCFFLSHGKEEKICDRDGRLIPLKELINMFVDHCPQMASKPKLFFAQICRDSEDETEASASASPGVQTSSTKTDGIPICPGAMNILLGFATTSGRQAYRCSNDGSPYIEQLTQVLLERGHKDSLFEVLMMTRQSVEVTVAIQNKDMCPCYISTLTRPIIFSLLDPDLRDSVQEASEDRPPGLATLGLSLR